MEENYDKYTEQKEEDEEEEEEEEGYIDMEVQLVAAAESAAILWEVVTLKQLKAAYQHSNGTSNSNHNKRHHHQYQHHHHQQQQQQRRRDDSREFEFDMSGMAARSGEAECDSPADELFYKGQLLPLHMPPRMHMLQKLVLNSTSISHASAPHADVAQSFYSSPLPSPSPSPAPSSSRDVSGELLLLPLPQSSSSSSSFGDARRPWKQRLKGVCTAVLRTLREGGTINVTGCCSANAAPPRRPATETKQKQRQRERQRQRQREFMEAAAGRRGGVFKQQQQQQRRSFSETACRNRAATSAAAFKRSNSGVVSVSVSVDVENAIAHCKQCQAPRT